MIYIEIENNKIKGMYCSAKLPSNGKDYREVPSWFPGSVGQDIREFNKEWELLPLGKRIQLGLIPDAERYKASGEELVPKSIEELVRDGLEPAPSGMKLDPMAPFDEPRFILMTREELVEASLLSAAEALKLDLQDEERSLLSRLNETDWYVVRAAETGEPIPEQVRVDRKAARERISAIRASLV